MAKVTKDFEMRNKFQEMHTTLVNNGLLDNPEVMLYAYFGFNDMVEPSDSTYCAIKLGENIHTSLRQRYSESGPMLNNMIKAFTLGDLKGYMIRDKKIHSRVKKQIKKLHRKGHFLGLRWAGPKESNFLNSSEAYYVSSLEDINYLFYLFECAIEECIKENIENNIKVDPDCLRNNSNYSLNFGLREYQKNLVEQMFNILTERKEVLGYISTRAGKSFMALKTLLDMGKERILIISPEPSAKSSFKKIVMRHVIYEGYHWINQWDKGCDISTLEGKDKIVVFCSFQVADLKKDCIQALLETGNFDACIIDEIHKASDTLRSKAFIDALDIPYKLYLSGTPFNDLYQKRFDPECVVEYDFLRFIEECKRAEEKGREGYPRLPQMHIRLIDHKRLDDYIKSELSEDYDCSIDTIAKCRNEDVVGSFLRYLLCGAKRVQKSLAAPNKIVDSPNNKIIMYLPERKDADFFYKCAKRCLGDKFNLMNLNDEEASASELEESINNFFEENEKAVVFTCAKATTGVTIPELDTIYILKSVPPENFVQTAFRTMNECYGKNHVYIYILQDEILFRVISEYTSVTNSICHKADERDIVLRFYNCIDFQQLTGDYAAPQWITCSLEEMVGGVRKYNRITSNEKLQRNIMKNYSLDNLPVDVDFTEVYEKLFKDKKDKKSSSEKIYGASTGVVQSDANKEEAKKGKSDSKKESWNASEKKEKNYVEVVYKAFVETFFGYINYIILNFEDIMTSEKTFGKESICNYDYFDCVMSKVKYFSKKDLRENFEDDSLVDFCYRMYTSIIENNKGLFQEQINAIRNAQKAVLEAITDEDKARLRAELNEYLPRVATEDSAGIPYELLKKMLTKVMRDSNNVSERETLYVIPFVKDTFWNKDYKKVLTLLEELEIPLKNIIGMEGVDTSVKESNFDNDFYKSWHESSGITFFKLNLVEGNDICIEGFNTLLYIINNRLLEKDYFVKIIMNPPYKGSLHLEIIDQMLKTFPEADIVNISPIGWLQDLTAEFKKDVDIKKYRHLLDRLESLDVISKKDANKLFGIKSLNDLGIYSFTKKAFQDESYRFDTSSIKFNVPAKELAYRLLVEKILEHDRFNKGAYSSKPVKFILPVMAGTADGKDYGQLCAKNKERAYAFEISKSAQNSYTQNSYTIVSFNSLEERDNFHSSLFTKFYQFYVANIRRNTRTPPLLPFIPHFFNVKWEGKSSTIDGYKNPITDEMLYEYFGLTDEEIKTVEDFYKELKSR